MEGAARSSQGIATFAKLFHFNQPILQNGSILRAPYWCRNYSTGHVLKWSMNNLYRMTSGAAGYTMFAIVTLAALQSSFTNIATARSRANTGHGEYILSAQQQQQQHSNWVPLPPPPAYPLPLGYTQYNQCNTQYFIHCRLVTLSFTMFDCGFPLKRNKYRGI